MSTFLLFLHRIGVRKHWGPHWDRIGDRIGVRPFENITLVKTLPIFSLNSVKIDTFAKNNLLKHMDFWHDEPFLQK